VNHDNYLRNIVVRTLNFKMYLDMRRR